MTDVSDYLNRASSAQRVELEKIRQAVKRLVPDAEEVISYGIPTFKHNKRALIYYAAYKDHMSIHPASDKMIKVVGKELAGFRTGKGTLRFTENASIPEQLLKEIVLFRLAEISN